MKIERIKNAKRNMITSTFNKIIVILLAFVNRTAMITVLGSDYLGLSSLFTSILSVLSLAELGFGSAIVYSMYKPIADDDETTISMLLNFYSKIYKVVGSAIFIIGMLLIPFLDNLIAGTNNTDVNLVYVYILYLINTSLSYFLFAYRNSLLTAHQRNDVINNISSLTSVLLVVMQIIILYTTENYYFYIIVILLMTMLNNILIYIYTKKMYPTIQCSGEMDKVTRGRILTHIKSLMLHSVGGVIANTFDNIVISAYLGLTAIAIYNNYYYIYNNIAALIIAFYTGILAGVGNCMVTESLEKNERQFSELTFLNNLVCCFCGICLLCLYQPFMEAWLGPELMLGNTTVVLLAMYFYFNMSRRVVIVYKTAAGIWKADQYKPIISAVINLMINIYLIQRIGINAVIISTLFCFVVIEKPWETYVLFRDYFKKSTKDFYLGQLKFLLITMLIAGITYLASEAIYIENVYYRLGYKLITVPSIILLLILLIFNKKLLFLKKYIKR